MAARTTVDAVEEVLAGNYDTNKLPSLLPFVRAANLVTNRVAACALEKGITLSTDELREIETWLAAHFYAKVDRTYAHKRTRDAWGTFDGKTGMYLEATLYGQTAVILDYSGCLASMNAENGDRKVAVGFWLGKPPSQQIPYQERD